ncbi:MAG: retropepsin-like aspartic peptidase RloA3 [bacterium]
MTFTRWLCGYPGARALVFCLGYFLVSIFPVSAEERPVQIYGWVEKAIVFHTEATVKVKLDSGALTSSMDAKNIETFKRDGRSWVRFSLALEDMKSGEAFEKQLELPVKRWVRLRGAGGEERRPVVKLRLCIGDQMLNEQFSLRDRSNMIYPVLLGRRTIAKLGLLDVGSTFRVQPDCSKNKLWEN